VEFIKRTGESPFEICAEIGEGVDEFARSLDKAFFGPDGIDAEI